LEWPKLAACKYSTKRRGFQACGCINTYEKLSGFSCRNLNQTTIICYYSLAYYLCLRGVAKEVGEAAGFVSGIALSLSGVSEGSAVAAGLGVAVGSAVFSASSDGVFFGVPVACAVVLTGVGGAEAAGVVVLAPLVGDGISVLSAVVTVAGVDTASSV
jgi:hypothetical protein